MMPLNPLHKWSQGICLCLAHAKAAFAQDGFHQNAGRHSLESKNILLGSLFLSRTVGNMDSRVTFADIACFFSASYNFPLCLVASSFATCTLHNEGLVSP